MRIEVVRSGGLAGMTRRGQVDTEQFGDPQSALEWHRLVEAARPMLARLHQHAPAPEVRDGFVWTVSVDNTRCEVDDSSISGPLRDLAQRTLEEGRR